MKKYIHKNNLANLGFLTLGITLFSTSFSIGESTLIGMIFHLSGCAFFCVGIHKRWCHEICEEECKHE